MVRQQAMDYNRLTEMEISTEDNSDTCKYVNVTSDVTTELITTTPTSDISPSYAYYIVT